MGGKLVPAKEWQELELGNVDYLLQRGNVRSNRRRGGGGVSRML